MFTKVVSQGNISVEKTHINFLLRENIFTQTCVSQFLRRLCTSLHPEDFIHDTNVHFDKEKISTDNTTPSHISHKRGEKRGKTLSFLLSISHYKTGDHPCPITTLVGSTLGWTKGFWTVSGREFKRSFCWPSGHRRNCQNQSLPVEEKVGIEMVVSTGTPSTNGDFREFSVLHLCNI